MLETQRPLPSGQTTKLGDPEQTAQVRLAAANEVRARPDKERQRTSGIGHAWWLIGFSVAMGVSIVGSVLWVSP